MHLQPHGTGEEVLYEDRAQLYKCLYKQPWNDCGFVSIRLKRYKGTNPIWFTMHSQSNGRLISQFPFRSNTKFERHGRNVSFKALDAATNGKMTWLSIRFRNEDNAERLETTITKHGSPGVNGGSPMTRLNGKKSSSGSKAETSPATGKLVNSTIPFSTSSTKTPTPKRIDALRQPSVNIDVAEPTAHSTVLPNDIYQTPDRNNGAGRCEDLAMSLLFSSMQKLIEENSAKERLRAEQDLAREKKEIERERANAEQQKAMAHLFSVFSVLSIDEAPAEKSNACHQTTAGDAGDGAAYAMPPMLGFHHLETREHKHLIVQELKLLGVETSSQNWITLRDLLREHLLRENLLRTKEGHRNTKAKFFFTPRTEALKEIAAKMNG